MKKIATIIIIAFVLSIGIAYADIYPTTVIIREIDYLNDLVICEDYNGNEWVFEGIEDWDVNDIVSMIMNDNETELIYDDVIMQIRYSGHTEGL
jgi:hypothetical protein